EAATVGNGAVSDVGHDQVRAQRFAPKTVGVVQNTDRRTIRAVELLPTDKGARLVVLDDAGRLREIDVAVDTNPVSGETKLAQTVHDYAAVLAPGDLPERLVFFGTGDNLLAVWNDGRFVRYDVRDTDRVTAMERGDLLADDTARVTALEFILGRNSLA